MADVCPMGADDVRGCSGPGATLEKEKVEAPQGEWCSSLGTELCRKQLLGRVRTSPGATKVPVLAKSVRAYGRGLASRRFPKPHRWCGAGRRHLRPSVSTYLSLSLPPARTCPP